MKKTETGSSVARGWLLRFAVFVCGSWCGIARPQPLREQAERTLSRAVAFYHQQVAASGGYLWRYSPDLRTGEGEGKALATTVWVQPPGTPSVGMALLEAYQITRDPAVLEAARDAGMALVRGQLTSGGWDYRIEFGQGRERYAYRVEQSVDGRRNVTTLDDNTTQAALSFLMQLDQELEFGHTAVHEACEYALQKLLEAQYPNGAWPQRFEAAPDADAFPVLSASYPDSWSRTHPDVDYRSFYTFNDNTLADMIRTMFLASHIYDQTRYAAAARRGGDFILLAQMPEPQPAWAQQYDHQMHPAWARRFEPPAVTGGESQGVMLTLMDVFSETGDPRYLAPIPAALAYLESSQLPDGRLARFYELRSNKPLYFTRQYELTYDDGDLPTHYSFQVGSRLSSIRTRYERLRAGDVRGEGSRSQPKLTAEVRSAARRAIESLDSRGAWVTDGQLKTAPEGTGRIIDSKVFVARLRDLCRYLEAADDA